MEIIPESGRAQKCYVMLQHGPRFAKRAKPSRSLCLHQHVSQLGPGTLRLLIKKWKHALEDRQDIDRGLWPVRQYVCQTLSAPNNKNMLWSPTSESHTSNFVDASTGILVMLLACLACWSVFNFTELLPFWNQANVIMILFPPGTHCQRWCRTDVGRLKLRRTEVDATSKHRIHVETRLFCCVPAWNIAWVSTVVTLILPVLYSSRDLIWPFVHFFDKSDILVLCLTIWANCNAIFYL